MASLRAYLDATLPELPTGRPLDALPFDCGRLHSAGVDEVEEWREWTSRDSTHDQLRIEEVLDRLVFPGARILHVGVGNSGLARRFCQRVACIDGITIQPEEVRLAASLDLPRCRALLLNKFLGEMPARLGRTYHFIVDNNPSSFSCCRRHFFTMLRSYRRLAVGGGLVLTDRWGLEHSVTGNDVRWKLSWEDWSALGESFAMRPLQVTESVWALERPRSPALGLRRYWRRLGLLRHSI